MVHEDIIARRAKKEGKHIEKNDKVAKSQKSNMASARPETNDSGGTIAVNTKKPVVSSQNANLKDLDKLNESKKSVEKENKWADLEKFVPEEENIAPKKLMDCIEFSNGKNILSLKLFKTHNRMYKIQAFLNDQIEIRPVSYNGGGSANAYWNLLKGAVK